MLGCFLSADPLVAGSSPLIVNLALSSVQGLNMPAKLGSFAASRAPGNPQSLDRYSYVLNNPLRRTDPTGLQTQEEWAALAAAGERLRQEGIPESQWASTLLARQQKIRYKGALASMFATTLTGWSYDSPGGYDTNGDGIIDDFSVRDEDPDAMDCSYLVFWAYRQAGIDTGLGDQRSSSYWLYGWGTPIEESELQPDDMVFYDTDPRKDGPDHVGLYIGNGMVMMAKDYGKPAGSVALHDPGYDPVILGYGRPPLSAY